MFITKFQYEIIDFCYFIRASPTPELTDSNASNKLEYLSQLLKDKRQLAAVPNMFIHIERLLDQGKYRLITY